jgi:aldose 1-epimerase
VDVIELEAGDAVAVVSPVDGGRIAQLTIGGFDVLVGGDSSTDATEWGCFPLVPWAGRLRHGQFDAPDGRHIQMPIDWPPHAIHGTGHTTRWEVLDQSFEHAELTCQLDWPLGGRAHQHLLLSPDALVCVLTVVAEHEPMPVTVGWHPWFVKPADDHLRFDAYYPPDDEQIPLGTVAPAPPRPWDDCLIGPHQPLALMYPGGLRLTVQSDCDHWVVLDRQPHATCVEPQSGPPNALNTGAAQILQPGEMLQRTMTISWH